MSFSEVKTSKLKFSVDSILGNTASPVRPVTEEVRPQEPPCAGCVAALYRCCRDEPLLQLPLPLSYTHLHPALRPTTGRKSNLLPSLTLKFVKSCLLCTLCY